MIGTVFYVICGIFFFAYPQFVVADKTIHHDLPAEQQAIVIGTGTGCFIGAMINLYFWICVFSFLKGLKSGMITSPP